MRVNLLVAAAAGALALTIGGTASAAQLIALTDGNFGGSGVHSTPGLNASTVTGTVDGTLVTLSTVGDTLVTSGGGESKFEVGPEPGSPDVFNDLTINFATAWQRVTFNLNALQNTATSFHLAVNGVAFEFDRSGLGNGQNKYILTGTGGAYIQNLSFTFNPGIVDIRQIRVEGPQPIVPGIPGVPEPATWAMMLVGFGGIGGLLRRSRRQARMAAA